MQVNKWSELMKQLGFSKVQQQRTMAYSEAI